MKIKLKSRISEGKGEITMVSVIESSLKHFSRGSFLTAC